MRTSTSGCSARISVTSQATKRRTAAAKRPMMRGDVQPHSPPSLTPRSRHTSQPESVSTASGLMRPGALMGDSGTQKMVATSAIAVMTAGIQNSQWIERFSTIGPAMHDRDARTDADQRRDQADRPGHALARELVADDAEREREDRAAAALDHARHDHHGDRGRERRDDRADDQRCEHDQEHALLAEHVAEAPEHRRRDRGADEVRREHPGDGRLARVAAPSRSPGAPAAPSTAAGCTRAPRARARPA